MQSGRGEDENRIAFGENASRKVAGSLELTATLVPAHACPVVEALHGKMEVLGGLQFNDGEAALAGDAEQVDDGAVAGGKGGNLRIEHGGVEA